MRQVTSTACSLLVGALAEAPFALTVLTVLV
jgi:hypothetical protein